MALTDINHAPHLYKNSKVNIQCVVNRESSSKKKMASQLKQYTIEDVKKHNTEDDVWMIIHDKVYDLTKFLDEVHT